MKEKLNNLERGYHCNASEKIKSFRRVAKLDITQIEEKACLNMIANFMEASQFFELELILKVVSAKQECVLSTFKRIYKFVQNYGESIEHNDLVNIIDTLVIIDRMLKVSKRLVE